jgi:acetolactate synthase-1/2/3 large subunit
MLSDLKDPHGQKFGWPDPVDEAAQQACPAKLDDAIAEMLAYDGPVMFDCRVHKTSNCFPMIPSGAAHTDMILSADQVSGTMDDEAKALV